MSEKMDFTKICRTCLGSDDLNPIFNEGIDQRRYFSALYLTTGIKMNINDGLPQNMCTQCMMQSDSALKFRKQCQDSEKQLLALKNNLNEVSKCKKQRTKKESYQEIQTEVDDIQTKMKTAEDVTNDIFLSDEETSLLSEENPLVDCNVQRNVQENADDSQTDRDIYEITSSNPVKGNRVTCNLCQMELSIRSVAGHMARRHPGADETKVKCELCEVYVTRNRMNRHKVMMHGSEGFKCGYCKIDFESKEVLLDHVSTCSAKKKKRKAPESSRQLSECDICHKTMQKASLRLHKAVKHAGLRPVCEHCGVRFGNKYRLTEHYRAKHGYEKFKCSYCDFESAAIMAMRNHERRHRGEKPFVCKLCGAKFHAAYLLAQHNQSHRTEKLIKCEQCPARFKANNSLNMHKLTCHSTSLYRCTMCVRAYSCRHYAVKHLRQVHQYTGPVPRLQRVPVKPDDEAN